MGDNQLDRGGEMRTPDARLSAAERAALADLEAAAAAADPHLAARLRGTAVTRIRTLLPRLLPGLAAGWSRVLSIRWWGVPVTVAGLALMVLGVSAGLAVSLVGVVATAVGLRVLAEMAALRLRRPKPEAAS